MSGILERLDAGSLARCLSSCRLLKIVGIDAVEVRTPDIIVLYTAWKL